MSLEDDVRTQQLAAQLFSGVAEKPRSSAGRGQLATRKALRHSGKTNTGVPDPGSPFVDNELHSSQRPALRREIENTNVELLYDFDSVKVNDSEEATERSKTYTIQSSTDMAPPHDNHSSDIPEPAFETDNHLFGITGNDPGMTVRTSDEDRSKCLPLSHNDSHLLLRTSHADPGHTTTEQVGLVGFAHIEIF